MTYYGNLLTIDMYKDVTEKMDFKRNSYTYKNDGIKTSAHFHIERVMSS